MIHRHAQDPKDKVKTDASIDHKKDPNKNEMSTLNNGNRAELGENSSSVKAFIHGQQSPAQSRDQIQQQLSLSDDTIYQPKQNASTPSNSIANRWGTGCGDNEVDHSTLYGSMPLAKEASLPLQRESIDSIDEIRKRTKIYMDRAFNK